MQILPICRALALGLSISALSPVLSPVLAMDWELGGFYSLTAVSSSPFDDLHRYAPQGDQDRSVSRVDLAADSKVGVMLSADIAPRWRFSSQLLARRGSSNEDPIQARLAFIEYRPDGQWTIKAGRTVQGLLLNEEAMFTDYANLLIRAAQEPYAQVPKTMIDGIAIAHSAQFGEVTTNLRASVGQLTYYSQQFQRKVRDSAGVALDVNYHDLLIHAGYRSLRVGFFNAPATTAATEFVRSVALAQGREDIAEGYDFGNVASKQYSVGLEYKSAPWTVVAEALYTKSSFRPSPHNLGWKAVLGYAFGNVTPYLGVGRYTYSSPKEDQIAVVDRTSGVAVATANYLAQASSGAQATLSAGIRWDLAPKTALKLQWDRIQRNAGVQGWFVSPRDSSLLGPLEDNHTNVLSASLQGVF